MITVSRQFGDSPRKGNTMTDLGLSTIAQLLFPNEQSIDFARIVAELEGVLSRLQSQDVKIAWD